MSSLLITDMQNLLFTAADADEGADKDKQEEEVSEEQEKDPAPEEEEDPDQKPEDSEDSPSTDPAPEQKQEGTPPGGLPTQPGEEEDKVVKVIDQFKKDLDNLKEQRIIDTLKKTYNQIEDAAKAEEEDYEVETELLQAREAGPTIIDEAVERGVDLILMGVRYKRSFGQFSLGNVVPYVLKNTPCRVILYQHPIIGEPES